MFPLNGIFGNNTLEEFTDFELLKLKILEITCSETIDIPVVLGDGLTLSFTVAEKDLPYWFDVTLYATNWSETLLEADTTGIAIPRARKARNSETPSTRLFD